MNRGKRRLIGLLAVCCLLVLLYSLRNQLLPPLGRWLNVATPPHKTQCVMTLGGRDERRPFVAATLVRHGYAEQVIIHKLASSPDVREGNVLPTDEIFRQVFLFRGVEEQDFVMLDSQVRTTFDEAEALSQFLATKPTAQVTVVTDDYHTRRARWVFRRSLGDRAMDVHFVAAPVDGVAPENWWKTRDGLKSYTSEYLKLGYYWCRYGWGLVWVGTAAVLIVVIWWRRRVGPSGLCASA